MNLSRCSTPRCRNPSQAPTFENPNPFCVTCRQAALNRIRANDAPARTEPAAASLTYDKLQDAAVARGDVGDVCP